MEHINLQIHNYKYSRQQLKELESKLEMFIKQIPCNARVLLNLDYKEKIFYGKLKVNFNGKSFFAQTSASLMIPLTGLLCKKVQKQIMRWKKTRTVEEITGVIALPYSEVNFQAPRNKVG